MYTVNNIIHVHGIYVGNESIELTVRDYPPGSYNIIVNATDIYGQTAREVVHLYLSGIYSLSWMHGYMHAILFHYILCDILCSTTFDWKLQHWRAQCLLSNIVRQLCTGETSVSVLLWQWTNGTMYVNSPTAHGLKKHWSCHCVHDIVYTRWTKYHYWRNSVYIGRSQPVCEHYHSEFYIQ